MQWEGIIWEILVKTAEELLFLYLLLHQLEYEDKNRPYIWVGAILKILLFTFLNLKFSNLMSLLLLLFFDIFFSMLLFSSNRGRKLLWVCIFVMIILLANNAKYLFAYELMKHKLYDLDSAGTTNKIMSFLYLFICSVLVYAFTHLRKEDVFLPVYICVLLILLVSLGIVISNQLLSIIIHAEVTGVNDTLTNRLEFINYTILFIIFGFVILIEYSGIILRQNKNFRSESLINGMEKKHYETLNTTFSALKSLEHDYRTHLQVILSLSKEDKKQELEDYVMGLKKDLINNAYHLISTKHPILDALLSAKMLVIQKFSIQFSYEVYLLRKLPFDDVQFTLLIGNLLDNAIEACQCLEDDNEKYINFSIKPFHDMLYIYIENSTNNKCTYYPDGTIKTTKKESGHGIGLKRVQKIIEDVQGFCNVYPEVYKFTVKIMVPFPEFEKGISHGN